MSLELVIRCDACSRALIDGPWSRRAHVLRAKLQRDGFVADHRGDYCGPCADERRMRRKDGPANAQERMVSDWGSGRLNYSAEGGGRALIRSQEQILRTMRRKKGKP